MRSILTALQEGRLFELPDAGKARALEFLARIIDANPDIEVGTDAIEEIQKRELECNTGIGTGGGVFVLAAEPDFAALLEKDPTLPQRLGAGAPFPANGRQVFVTGAATFGGGRRVLYQCVAVSVAG